MKTSNRFLVSAAMVLAPVLAYGQFAEDALRFSQYSFGIGARGIALGGASVARTADYSSLFSNPATLTALRDFEVSLGFARNMYQNDAQYLGRSTTADNAVTRIENAGIVYPIPTSRGSLTLAFGYGRMSDYTSVASFRGYNGSTSLVRALAPVTDLWAMSPDEEQDLLASNIPFQIWLADTLNGFLFPVVTDSVEQSGTVYEGGGTSHYSFGGAIEVAPNISVGMSVNIVSGRYSYDREFIETDTRNVYTAYPYNVDQFSFISTIESRMTGFNALLGLTVRKPGRYQAGLTYRTPTVYNITETFSDDGTSSFDDGTSYSSGYTSETTYRVMTSPSFSAGLSVNIFQWLAVMGDAEYTDWTEVEFDTKNPDLLEENRYIKRAFRQTTNLRGGVELSLLDWGIVLRGGMAYLPSPYKGDPASFDRKYFTGGLGIELDRHTMFNVSVARGTWNTFRDNYYINSLGQTSSTNESVTSTRIYATLAYRF